MKIVELIDLDFGFCQQVIYIQGHTKLKNVMKHFKKGEFIYDAVKEGLEDFEKGNKSYNGYVVTMKYDNGFMIPILVMCKPVDTSDPRSLSILAHEVIHVLQEIKNKFLSNQTEKEFEAYLYEKIFFEILTLIKNGKDKQQKKN